MLQSPASEYSGLPRDGADGSFEGVDPPSEIQRSVYRVNPLFNCGRRSNTALASSAANGIVHGFAGI